MILPVRSLLSAGLILTATTGTLPAQSDAAAVEARRKAAYVTCSACHGVDGKGLPTNPPMAPSLVGSKLATAAPEIPVAIVLKGIQKLDTKYLNVMAPLGAAMSDQQIADALTYIRTSWGNKGTEITPAEVKETREKYQSINASLPRSAFEKKAAALAAAPTETKPEAPPAAKE